MNEPNDDIEREEREDAERDAARKAKIAESMAAARARLLHLQRIRWYRKNPRDTKPPGFDALVEGSRWVHFSSGRPAVITSVTGYLGGSVSWYYTTTNSASGRKPETVMFTREKFLATFLPKTT